MRVKKNHYEIEGANYDAYVLVWYKDADKNISRKNQLSKEKETTRFKKVLCFFGYLTILDYYLSL